MKFLRFNSDLGRDRFCETLSRETFIVGWQDEGRLGEEVSEKESVFSENHLLLLTTNNNFISHLMVIFDETILNEGAKLWIPFLGL